MSTSAVPAVIDYLVATFTAASTLGGAGVQVVDGPAPSGIYAGQYLWVGVDTPDRTSGIAQSATSSQKWAGPGNRWRNEQLSINLVAQGWTGDTKIKTARDLVYAIINAAEDILRINADLGKTVLFTNPGSTRHRLSEASTDKGAFARVSFNVDAQARIGSAN